MEDGTRSGRPVSASNDDLVREKIVADSRLTIRELSVRLDMGYGTVQGNLTKDLGMQRVCAKLVSHLLNNEQRQRRILASSVMLEAINEDATFFKG